MEIHWYFAAQDGTHPWNPNGVRVTDFAYMQQLAGAIDHNGFAGALIATLPGGTDPWSLATGLAMRTQQMKFIVAQYAGVISPLWLAQMAASVDQISNGRLIINIIMGAGPSAPQLGISDNHEERYALAEEYWGVYRRLMVGETVSFEGKYVKLKNAKLLLESVQKPYPELMMGGTSASGLAFAARHADCWLSLGVPPPIFAEKVARVKELAAAQGRKLRFGIRAYVIVRDTVEEAWAAAQWQYDRMDAEAVKRRVAKLGKTDVEGDTLLASLIKPGVDLPKDARAFEIYPGLWGGIGLIRQGTGTTLVGDPKGIVALMREYEAAGAEVFILGNYPHIEEAYRFADTVFPLIKDQKKNARVSWY
ncbi:MAG: LLM class flavin-dependent oxidoreductase [Burkholderiales bacterium]